ncbi:hypothetical protein HG530_012618 [Fusarium avenaceum]|nr:hypothetical protein HG530_012618 [Fusarium avenaceum]
MSSPLTTSLPASQTLISQGSYRIDLQVGCAQCYALTTPDNITHWTSIVKKQDRKFTLLIPDVILTWKVTAIPAAVDFVAELAHTVVIFQIESVVEVCVLDGEVCANGARELHADASTFTGLEGALELACLAVKATAGPFGVIGSAVSVVCPPDAAAETAGRNVGYENTQSDGLEEHG